MGRDANISADQVNAIADALKAEGGKPTARAVRERLGNTGSMGTITKLLRNWKASHTRQTSSTLALPVDVQNTLLDFMERELAGARAGLEAELAEQQQESTDLAAENERQAETIETINEELTVLSAEKASIEGKAAQLESDLNIAHQERNAERQAAENARTELAKAQLRLEAMPRLVEDLENTRADLVKERGLRTEAERKAAVLEAQKADMTERLNTAESDRQRVRGEQADELQRVRTEAASRLAEARTEAAAHIDEARADAARATEQAQKMQDRADIIAEELTKQHVVAKAAAEEAAELRGRLATATAASVPNQIPEPQSLTDKGGSAGKKKTP